MVVVPVATFPVYAALVVMDKGQAPEVHLVRVTADDGTWRIWLAATARDVESLLDSSALTHEDMLGLYQEPG